MRWAGHVVHIGELRNSNKSLVWKSEGKRSFAIPRHRWMYNGC